MANIAHVPPGVYPVRLLDANGVPVGTPVDVTVATLTASIVETSPPPGTPLTLSTNAPPGTLYQWIKNGVDIPGATLPPPYTPPDVVTGDLIRCRLTAPNQPSVTTDPVTITSTGFTADFTGANGATPPNWASIQGAATLTIQSNEARLTATADQVVRWRFTSPGLSGNVFSQARYRGILGSGAHQPTVIITSDTDAGYDFNINTSTYVRLIRRTSAGTGTEIANATLGTAVAIDDDLRITVEDIDANTVRVRGWIDGVQVISVNDTNAARITGTKRGGLGGYISSAGSSITYDAYSFGSF